MRSVKRPEVRVSRLPDGSTLPKETILMLREASLEMGIDPSLILKEAVARYLLKQSKTKRNTGIITE